MDSDVVPPSSPPRATTANVPDSPFFEPHYNAFSPKSSSPPPLFSSDDSRESADIANYESPRIFKNKRKGRWWDNGESAYGTLEFKKAKITRNFDSGVYMMSDGSDSSESLLLLHKAPFGLDGTYDSPSHDAPVAPADPPMSHMDKEEHVFCIKMYTGLDRNSETYNFNRCDLQDCDIRRIGELASVIKNAPDPGNDLPTEGQYRSMVPELYVNLNDNQLRYLTPSLFNVQNLTSLVLVNNDIEELPSQIRHLRNLRELNISNNNMKWFPFELLELYGPHGKGNLAIIGDSGVPWLEPKTRQNFDSPGIQSLYHDLAQTLHDANPNPSLAATQHVQQLHHQLELDPDREQKLWHMRYFELSADAFGKRGVTLDDEEGIFSHHPSIRYLLGFTPPKYIARTPVSYFNEAGMIIKGSPKSPSSNDDDFAVITETERGAHGVPSTWFTPPSSKAINSLFTMCLHSALRHKDQEDLTIHDLRDCIGEPVPPAADAVLKQAEVNNRGGYGEFRKCNVCSKEYVVARAEWIEWWCPKILKVFPFKVRVCSWGCVPDRMMRRPERELEWD